MEWVAATAVAILVSTVSLVAAQDLWMALFDTSDIPFYPFVLFFSPVCSLRSQLDCFSLKCLTRWHLDEEKKREQTKKATGAEQGKTS
jgi:hypothetical protein